MRAPTIKHPHRSIWTRILEAISALAKGESLSAVFDRLRTPPERSVAFAIAVVALGAKMAKADGIVTRNEVTAFREVFHIASQDEAGAARVFNLARQDVAGFEEYATRIRGMFDGQFHPNEDDFLNRVAEIFDLPTAHYRSLRARFVPGADPDPYDVLGVTPDMPMEEIRKAWRTLVRDNHPDALIARGVPDEVRYIAEKRMIDINRAWEALSGKVPA